MKNELTLKKKEFRIKQFSLRKKLFTKVKKIFNKKLIEDFFYKINLDNIQIVSSFNSINTEIDTSELNKYILKKNKILCLPVIFKKDKHLLFRKFTNKSDMIKGYMNIEEPSKNNELLIPDLLFVPCLAYDTLGYRLGYGGGYYDKTFDFLRNNNKKFISVGYAFDDQKVPEVPKDKFDIRLDYVITEKKLYSFI